jgi:acetyl esterase/lipase
VPNQLSKQAPVIVFFYGGSWQSGKKEDYLFAGQAFASKGYVAVIADYRVYPQVYFPAFLEDGAQAFAWVHKHIGEYSGDADELFLAGHSAGGYIAVMLAADTSYFHAAGADEKWIKGVIGIAGPYDFLPFTDPKIIALFSTAEGPKTQPINFVHAGMPPVFLATGDADTTVLPRNTHHLADRLIANYDSVEKHVYPGVAHIGIALSLANGFRYKTSLLEDISHFVDKVINTQ